MTDTSKYPTTGNHGNVELRKNVFVAYTDLAAAGSRALLGIDMRVEYVDLVVPQLKNCRPACERDEKPEPSEENFHPLQILNHKYEEFSLVIVNTVVPASKCHYLANKILDLCAQSPVERITVLTVLKLDLPRHHHHHAMFENCFRSQKLTEYPPLPTDTPTTDPFLNTFLQLVQVEYIACNVLTIPGTKVHAGQASYDDGSKEKIQLFQQTISNLYKLRFDLQRSLLLHYKEKNDPDGDMAAMIYL